VGCPSLFEVSEEDDPEEARIILEKSIDNVEIGDDSTTVIVKLGEPDEIALGDYAGYLLIYTRGTHNGITVTLHSEKGVQGVSARSPYNGFTETGIGIGTPRETVVQALGDPGFSAQLNNDRTKETYRYGPNSFSFVYREGKTEAVGLGGIIQE
jgi:hypothetical protein